MRRGREWKKREVDGLIKVTGGEQKRKRERGCTEGEGRVRRGKDNVEKREEREIEKEWMERA